MATMMCSQGHPNAPDAATCVYCGEHLQQKKSGIPAWAIVLIVLAIGCVSLPVIAILAVTFLGSSASTKFSSVGSSIDLIVPAVGIRHLWAWRRELLR